MALWVCSGCTCRYAVGAPACPQCRSTDHEEDSVAKSTVLGGASSEWAGPGEVGYIPPAPEGSEDVSPGTSSSTSGSPPAKSSTSGPSGPPSPAPATVSPSATPRPRTPAPAANSSALSAPSSTPATTSGPSQPDAPSLKAPKAEWAEHAVATGAGTPEEVAEMTKAEIVDSVAHPEE